MVGEAEEVFAGIAAALENGTAQRVYTVTDKPDMSLSPIAPFRNSELDSGMYCRQRGPNASDGTKYR